MRLHVGNWSTDDDISIANSRYSAGRLVPGTPIGYDRAVVRHNFHVQRGLQPWRSWRRPLTGHGDVTSSVRRFISVG